MMADTSKPVICPGVYDALTARISIEQGFESLYITPTGTFASLLGRSDLGMMTLSEMARNAHVIAGIAHKSGVPVIADPDPSFGGLTVEQATREYMRADVAAIILSDLFPLPILSMQRQRGPQVMTEDDFFSLIRRVGDERKAFGKDLVIIARSVAQESLGYGLAASRLITAISHGADAICLEGASATETQDLYEIVKPIPMLLSTDPRKPSPEPASLDAGICNDYIILFPGVALGATLHGVRAATRFLKDYGWSPASASYEQLDLERLLGQA